MATERMARALGAFALLVAGGVHLQQYSAAHFAVIPTIGLLFLANLAASIHRPAPTGPGPPKRSTPWARARLLGRAVAHRGRGRCSGRATDQRANLSLRVHGARLSSRDRHRDRRRDSRDRRARRLRVPRPESDARGTALCGPPPRPSTQHDRGAPCARERATTQRYMITLPGLDVRTDWPATEQTAVERAVARTPPQMLALTSFRCYTCSNKQTRRPAHRLRTENGALHEHHHHHHRYPNRHLGR